MNSPSKNKRTRCNADYQHAIESKKEIDTASHDGDSRSSRPRRIGLHYNSWLV
jgi:hypothetical protein